MAQPSRLTERRAQNVHEDLAFNSILEENARLQEDLSRMVSFKRQGANPVTQTSEATATRNRRSGREPEDGHSQHSKRDTAVTFGENQPTRQGFHSAHHAQPGFTEDSRHTQGASESERISELEERLRETTDALEYMKKRERSLQEEVKTLTQVAAKKDSTIQSLESKNRILIATKIEVESKMADILDQADEVLRKYDRLREINLILQDKLVALETEVGARSNLPVTEQRSSRKQSGLQKHTTQNSNQKEQKQANTSARSKASESKSQEQRQQESQSHQSQQEGEEEYTGGEEAEEEQDYAEGSGGEEQDN